MSDPGQTPYPFPYRRVGHEGRDSVTGSTPHPRRRPNTGGDPLRPDGGGGGSTRILDDREGTKPGEDSIDGCEGERYIENRNRGLNKTQHIIQTQNQTVNDNGTLSANYKHQSEKSKDFASTTITMMTR